LKSPGRPCQALPVESSRPQQTNRRHSGTRTAYAGWALGAGVVLWTNLAWAHTLLTAPAPRDASDSHKDPTGPCGVARAADQPTNGPHVAGSKLDISWTETVDHPGCFVIDFSASGDAGWTTLTTLPHRQAGTTPRPYSTQVTLPSAACTDCTLRLRQIMLDAEPAAGEACPPPDLAQGLTYYSCANVVLEASSVTATAGSASTSPDAAPAAGSCSYGRAPSHPAAAWALCGVVFAWLVRRRAD
jgi:hypothetical protein